MPDLIEKFEWLAPEFTLTDVGKNKIRVKGVAMKGNAISRNNRKYVIDELRRSARTFIGKPVTINHDSKKIIGDVKWMEYSDASDALEYLMDIDKQPYVDMIRNKSATVRGVSIEAGYLHNICERCGQRFYTEPDFRNHMEKEHFIKVPVLEPHGMLGQALSVVLSPEEPGYVGTTFEPLTETINQLSKLCETITKTKMEEEEYKMSKELKTPGVAIRTQEWIIAPTGKQPSVKEQEEPKQCPEGQHRDEKGECVPNEKATEQKEHECPEGEHWNEQEGKCVPNETATEQEEPSHECPTGQHWSEEEEKCVLDTEEELETAEVKLVESKSLAPKLVILKEAKTIPKLSLAEPCDWGKFGYSSFEDCVASNSDKGDPEAYCGSLKAKEKLEIARYNKVVETLNVILDELAKPMQFEMPVQDESWKKQTKQLAEAINKVMKEIKALPKDDTSWKERNKHLTETANKLVAELKILKESLVTVEKSGSETFTKFTEQGNKQHKDLEDFVAKTEAKFKEYDTIKDAVAIADKNVLEIKKGFDEKLKSLEEENAKLKERQKIKETTDISLKEQLEKQQIDIDNFKEWRDKHPEYKGKNKPLTTDKPLIKDPMKGDKQ